MPRLTPISHRDFVRRLRRLGFEGPYPGTKHPMFVRKGRPYHVPNPHGHEISVPLLRRILRELEITPQQWEAVR